MGIVQRGRIRAGAGGAASVVLLLVVSGLGGLGLSSPVAVPSTSAPHSIGAHAASVATGSHCVSGRSCGDPGVEASGGHALPRPSNGSSTGNGSSSGPGWSDLSGTLATAPTGRTQPAIAYDPAIRKVVLFGGYDVSVAADGDTWEFANNNWTDLTSNLSVAPPARWGGAMVWDPVIGQLVLFGGRNVTSYFNDTWLFNGTAWSPLVTSAAPRPRAQFELAYDPVDAVVLLHGGDWRNLSSFFSSWNYLSDVWSFQNGTWTNLTAIYTPTPGVRGLGQAAYDPWNRSVVEVGGLTSGSASGCTPSARVGTLVSNRSYLYPANVGPGELAQAMMTYVPDGPYLFVFGGYSNSSVGCAQVNSLWVRVEGQWLNITGVSASAPSSRYLGGIAYDAADNEVVLFGGNGGGAYLGDTWTFVTPSVTASIAKNRTGGEGPLRVAFTATATGGSEAGFTYNWSFGDGTYLNGSSVTHLFSSAGKYTIRLNVSDLLNRTASVTTTATVVSPLVASPSASNPVGSVPLTESFMANPTGGERPFTGRWTFGDGGSATGLNVSHTYSVAGAYVVNLTLTDAFGDQSTGNVTLTLAPTLVASIGGGARLGVAPFMVNFTSSPSGGNPPYLFAWSFGDGNVSSQASPSHIFTAVGFYTVKLVVEDALGRNASATTTITVVPPLAASLYASTGRGVSPLAITFTVLPTGGIAPYSATWTFGDGGTGQGLNVSHTFQLVGNHTVAVNVTDSQGHVARSVTEVQVVSPLASTMSANATLTEEPYGFGFSAVTIGGLAPLNWTWTFGDGGSAWGAGPHGHTYRSAGAYVVRLTVTDKLGEVVHDSLAVTVKGALVAALSASSATLWVGNLTNLTSTASGGEGPYTYAWSNLPTGCAAGVTAMVSCRPTAVGSFNVTITVGDALNRTVAKAVTIEVVPVPPSTPATLAGSAGLALWLLGALAIVVAGVGVTVWAVRRRRPPTAAGEESSSGPDDAGSYVAPPVEGEPYAEPGPDPPSI